MKELKLREGMRALVIVAHPDDETIWMGGTILMNPLVKWTIHCLTRSSDADREPKFQKICRIYGAQAVITDLEDVDKMSVKDSIPEIKKIIKAQIGRKKYDCLFTHGSNGEYGHPRHIGAHLAVKEMLKAGVIKFKKVYFFNYRKTSAKSKLSMRARSDSDYFIKLSQPIYMIKKRLQAEIHGYAWDGIDNRLCTNPEAYKVFK